MLKINAFMSSHFLWILDRVYFHKFHGAFISYDSLFLFNFVYFHTAAVLAEESKRIASLYSDVLSATILDVEQCKELKMGSYLAVAAASANPPHFIHLCYKPPGGEVKTKLALVGKGLTFDRFVYVSDC